MKILRGLLVLACVLTLYLCAPWFQRIVFVIDYVRFAPVAKSVVTDQVKAECLK